MLPGQLTEDSSEPATAEGQRRPTNHVRPAAAATSTAATTTKEIRLHAMPVLPSTIAETATRAKVRSGERKMRRRVGMRNAQPIAYPGTNATTTAKSSSGIVANQLINPHLTTVNALKPLVRGPGALSCTKQGYLRGLYTPEKPPEDPRKTRHKAPRRRPSR